MTARFVLCIAMLLPLQPSLAAETTLSLQPNLCRQALPTVRALWQHDLYDAPPALAAVMVAAIDGRLPQVRKALSILPPTRQRHWRQIAMLTAASTYQTKVVDGLLDDGAAVDGSVHLPPLKQAFYGQMLDAMGHGQRFGGPRTVKALKSAGLMDNRGQLLGPALSLAAECDDVATLDVLLRHHADVMFRPAPHIADALTVAVVWSYAGIVQRLLDYGASPCEEDHLIQAHKPGVSIATIGRRRGLPEELLARLACPTPPH